MPTIRAKLLYFAALFTLVACTGRFEIAYGTDDPNSKSNAAGDKNSAAAASEPPCPPLDGRDGHNLALEQFRPESMLKVAEHHLNRGKFPVVDSHMHPRYRLHEDSQQLDDFVKVMDRNNIAVCVSLDGQMGDSFVEHQQYLWTKYRQRFVIFANIDWRGQGKQDDPATWDCQRPDFSKRMAEQLTLLKAQGASGLKIFKEFGLVYKNPDGSLIKIDDPRWNQIWETCGKLGLPILIHTADPVAFFRPIDEKNERWEELQRHPDWSFYGSGFPSHDEVLQAFLRVVQRYPQTTFISAHVANNAEDLQSVGRWLDEHPNLYVDIAARINELGRGPYSARKFFLKYADRILFGTDGPRTNDRLVLHWRFLETFDEYFPYAENPFPPQGFWNIYGVGLPDDVLKKLYFENAIRLIPGIKERYAAYMPARSNQTPAPR